MPRGTEHVQSRSGAAARLRCSKQQSRPALRAYRIAQNIVAGEFFDFRIIPMRTDRAR